MGIPAAILGAGGLSALSQIFGSKAAAGAQTSAANQATAAQLAMFGITRSSLQPYIGGGDTALSALLNGRPGVKAAPNVWEVGGKDVSRAVGAGPPPGTSNVWDVNGRDVSRAVGAGPPAPGAVLDTHGTPAKLETKGAVGRAAVPSELQQLVQPINMDQATLEATPGYQWTLGQGEKSTENALAARGLGESGAQIKGAEQYATGLASQTYQQQFQNALANKQMAWQALYGTSGLGETAAAGLGTGATATGGQIGSNIIGAGNAQAGADIAGANAGTGIANSLVNALLIQNQLGRSATTGGLY